MNREGVTRVKVMSVWLSSSGYLLVYKVMEDTWKREAGLKWEVLEACVPSLSLPLTRRPLARIVVCFIDAVIMVTVGDRDGNCHMVSLPTSAAYTSAC